MRKKNCVVINTCKYIQFYDIFIFIFFCSFNTDNSILLLIFCRFQTCLHHVILFNTPIYNTGFNHFKRLYRQWNNKNTVPVMFFVFFFIIVGDIKNFPVHVNLYGTGSSEFYFLGRVLYYTWQNIHMLLSVRLYSPR
jgi:hypothetical protein